VKGREQLVTLTCNRSILVRGAVGIVFTVVQYGRFHADREPIALIRHQRIDELLEGGEVAALL